MRRFSLVFSLALLLLSSPVSAQAPPPPPVACAPVAPFTDSATFRFFPQTKHALGNGFKNYWDAHFYTNYLGTGYSLFGAPITEEFTEHDADSGVMHTVQYFERARFEYHPEFKGTPYEVELARIIHNMGL